MNKLNEVVQEIVAATGYPAADIIDGMKVLPPDVGGADPWPAYIHFQRFQRNEHGQKIYSVEGTHLVSNTVDLADGLWEKLEQACLADDPSLKGRKLVGGVELRNFHAYFLPEGEDQQWISTDTFSF